MQINQHAILALISILHHPNHQLLHLPADFLALALSLPIDSASFYLLVATQPCTVAWTVLRLATTCIAAQTVSSTCTCHNAVKVMACCDTAVTVTAK